MKDGYEIGKRRRAARKIMTLLSNLSAFTLEELSLEHKGYYSCIESMWEGFFFMVICICVCVHVITYKKWHRNFSLPGDLPLFPILSVFPHCHMSSSSNALFHAVL